MAKEQQGDLLVDIPDAPPWAETPAPVKPEPPEPVIMREDQTVPPKRGPVPLPTKRKPREVAIDDDSMPPTPEPPPASGLSAKNREKLECAKRYVDRLYRLWQLLPYNFCIR